MHQHPASFFLVLSQKLLYYVLNPLGMDGC